MPGLYDNLTLSNSQYIPKFIGSNYDQVSNMAEKLDQRYRENKSYSDKIAIMMAQDQYLENDQAIKDNLAKSIYGQINDISKSDENFENSSAAVSKLARDYFTNQHRLTALDNYKKVEEAKKTRNQLGADALNFGDNPDDFSTLTPDGQVRRFNNAIEKKADYSRKMQELLGKVADDGYTTTPSGQKVTFDDYERMLIKTGQTQYLNKTKLNNLVESLLPSYKVSGEGTQDIRRLKELEGHTGEPITLSDGQLTRQTNDIDENIRQRFRAIAAPQAYSKTALRWDDFGVPVTNTKLVNNSNPFSATNPGSVTDNTSLAAPTESSDEYTIQGGDGKTYQYYDKQGHLVTKDEIAEAAKSTGSTGGGSAQGAIEKLGDYTAVEVNPEQIKQQAEANYNRVRTSVPNGDRLYKDYKDFEEANKQAYKNHKKITPSGVRVEPEQAQQYDDAINRTIANSPLYFSDTRKPVQGLQQLAEDIGTSPSNIKLKAINVYYDSPRKDLPGGYVEAKIEVNDAKVKDHPTSVFIPLNDQFTALAEPIDTLYKNSFYQGKDTFTPERPFLPQIGGQPMIDKAGNKLAFYTVTYPLPKNQQQEGKPGYRTLVYSGVISPNASGGSDINFDTNNPITIGSWKQMMIQAMSGLFKNTLNSGQTFNKKDFDNQGLDY